MITVLNNILVIVYRGRKFFFHYFSIKVNIIIIIYKYFVKNINFDKKILGLKLLLYNIIKDSM